MGRPHVVIVFLQTLRHAGRLLRFHIEAATEKHRRSLPKSHSRGLQANGGEAGQTPMVCGTLGSAASFARISLSASRHSIDESVSFDSALISRGARLRASCVPDPGDQANRGWTDPRKPSQGTGWSVSIRRLSGLLPTPGDTLPDARRGNHLPASPRAELFFAPVGWRPSGSTQVLKSIRPESRPGIEEWTRHGASTSRPLAAQPVLARRRTRRERI